MFVPSLIINKRFAPGPHCSRVLCESKRSRGAQRQDKLEAVFKPKPTCSHTAHNGTFLHDGQRCGSSAVHHYKYTPLDSAVKYPALSQRCAPLSLQMQRLRAALCRLAAAVITLN